MSLTQIGSYGAGDSDPEPEVPEEIDPNAVDESPTAIPASSSLLAKLSNTINLAPAVINKQEVGALLSLTFSSVMFPHLTNIFLAGFGWDLTHIAILVPRNIQYLSSKVSGALRVDPRAKELAYNPSYDELFAPVAGPVNPFKSDNQRAHRNVMTGFVESAHMNAFQFQRERQTFETFGYARDPSADSGGAQFVGRAASEADKGDDRSIFEKKKTGLEKRRRERNMDPADLEGYTGPWGKFVDEQTVSKPDEETQKVMDEFVAKRRKKSRKHKQVKEAENADEKSILHIKEDDYQGRTFMVPPQDVGVKLREDFIPEKCFVPRKQIHTYQGHTKGIQVIRWLPKSAHLFISGSMDSKIKIWEVYRKRRCVRTYSGHSMAIKDVQFNNSGEQFLSASFDRYIKLWDTETGAIKSRFACQKMPYCIQFNPDEDKQHMFLAGMQDKKICQWDTRSGEIVQEYDRHLGPVDSITFFDGNRRFVSTSDDRSLRIWEWEIPVDTKLIQDPGLHAIPHLTKSANEKWIVGNSMDNRIMLFQVMEEKLRFAKKKNFKGHTTAGYQITTDWSPDMSYITSGDAMGRVFIWDWKAHRIVGKWKAHDNCCNNVLWHPHEQSKLLSSGWDGMLKLWE